MGTAPATQKDKLIALFSELGIRISDITKPSDDDIVLFAEIGMGTGFYFDKAGKFKTAICYGE
jgi:hypothetical protein